MTSVYRRAVTPGGVRPALCVSLLIALIIASGAWANTQTKSVLVVLSGVAHITGKDGRRHKTGYWLEEFSVPYQVFIKNGINVTVATPTGQRPVVDPVSIATDGGGKPLYWGSETEYAEGLVIKAKVLDEGAIDSLAALDQEGLERFDAIFVPGGYAPMEDLAVDANVGRALRYFHEHGKPTALLCHGPIALLSTIEGDEFPYRGYKVAAFSNSEEEDSEEGVGKYLQINVETALREAGVVYVKGDDWSSYVAEDRELLTGQNNVSSRALAEAVVGHLK